MRRMHHSLKENNMEQSVKLPVKLKFALAVGDFGKSTLQILNAFFLLWFYTDVAKIPAAAATVIMIIARIWDAVNDPMMGVIVDKTKSKEGRCRFWLKYLSVPAGVCIALSYCAPNLSKNGLIIWIAITYICQGMAQTATNVPFNTLLARITTDQEERVKLGQWRGFGGMIASTLITAIALPLVKWMGHGDQTKGFFKFAIICGIIYAAAFFFVYVASKGYEPSYEQEQQTTSAPEKKSVGQLLRAVVQNKVALLVCLTNLIFLIFNSLNGSSMVYYLQYDLHDTGLMKYYSVLSSVIGFFAVAAMGFMGKKFGNAKTCSISSALLIVSFGLRFITHDSIRWILFFCWGVEGIGTGLFAQMIYQCALDSMTYGLWKTGVDNQGTIMSVYTFAQKAGLAVGGIIASGLLTAFHYKANAAAQTPQVQGLFFAEIVTIPLVIFIILTFLFMYIAKYERMIPQMKKDIAEREAKAAAEHATVSGNAAASSDDTAVAETSETSETSEAPETSEISETTETSENSEASETSDDK